MHISIHALLAESDDNLTQGVFNLFAFLSTLSLRRATDIHTSGIVVPPISIHALLAESDFQLVYGVAGCVVFLSTLSLRRATGDGTHY